MTPRLMAAPPPPPAPFNDQTLSIELPIKAKLFKVKQLA